jgi:hypothetical protein
MGRKKSERFAFLGEEMPFIWLRRRSGPESKENEGTFLPMGSSILFLAKLKGINWKRIEKIIVGSTSITFPPSSINLFSVTKHLRIGLCWVRLELRPNCSEETWGEDCLIHLMVNIKSINLRICVVM